MEHSWKFTHTCLLNMKLEGGKKTTFRLFVSVYNNWNRKKTKASCIWLGNGCTKHAVPLANSSIWLERTNRWNVKGRISEGKRYAAILWTEVRARGFTFWLDSDMLWMKLMTVSYSRAVSSGILHMSRHSFTDAIHSEMSMKVCIVLCVCVCARKSMSDWIVPPCCIPTQRFLSFQIPFITLDGLFDAQQEGCVPLVQTWDWVKLFDLQ